MCFQGCGAPHVAPTPRMWHRSGSGGRLDCSLGCVGLNGSFCALSGRGQYSLTTHARDATGHRCARLPWRAPGEMDLPR